MKKLTISIDRARRVRLASAAFIALIAAITVWNSALRPDSAGALWGGFGLLAAALLFSYRNFIEIDEEARLVANRIGFLFPFPFLSRQFDTSGLRRITLCEVIARTRGRDGRSRTKRLYGIRINGASGDVLCTHSDFWVVRHAGERICRSLRVEFETRLFGESSVRAAEDVDLPLAERWRRAGSLKEAPRMGGSTQVIIEHQGDASVASMAPESGPRLGAVIILLAVLGALFVAGSMTEAPALLLFGLGAVAAFMIGGLILQSSGRNRVRFTASTVEVGVGMLPFRQRIAIDDIEELIDNGRELALLGDRGYVVIDQPVESGDRELLRQFIERQIAQRQGAAARTSTDR